MAVEIPVVVDIMGGINDAVKNQLPKAMRSMELAMSKNALKIKFKVDDKGLMTIKDILNDSTLSAKQLLGVMREIDTRLSSGKFKGAGGTRLRGGLMEAQEALRIQYSMLSDAENRAATSGNRFSASQERAASSASKVRLAARQVNTELETGNSRMAMLIKNSLRLIALHSAATFIRNIRSVTAEFELQKVALGSIIQDTERANSLFRQIKAAAIESPFEIKDLVTYTKQLSAYQIKTEKLFDTTMKLADISAGLGVEMNRLILAYGQVRAASVLRGQELRQFTEAGIPLVEKLAEKFTELNGKTVTTAEVFELISKRAVPFRMIEEIFNDMTSAGGMFYKMQEKQAKTLSGQWNNLKDAVSIMYDEIGRTDTVHNAMTTLINDARWLMLNWRKWADIIKIAGSAMLTHVAISKSIVIWDRLVAAAENAAAAAVSRREKVSKGLISVLLSKTAVEKIATKSTSIYAAATMRAALANTTFARTCWNLVAALASNPFGIILASAAALVGTFTTLIRKGKEVEEMVSDANRSIQSLTKEREYGKLVEQYEQLSKKTNLTAKETAILRDVSRELGKAFPLTTKAINSQTGALILDIEQLKKYSQEAQDTIKESMRAQIVTNNAEIKSLERRQEHIQKVLGRGYGFVDGSFYYGLSKDAKNAGVLNQKLVDATDKTRELVAANQDLQDAIDGVVRTTEDKEPYPPIPSDDKLKELRGQISEITDAYRKFIDLRKYLSNEASLKNIGIFFPTLSGFEPTYENTIKKLEDFLGKYKGNADATHIIQQAIANIKFDKVKKDMDEALRRISDDMKRSEAARNFYNDVLGLTGDQELSATLSMSVYGEKGQDFKDRVQKELYESLKSIDPKEVTGGESMLQQLLGDVTTLDWEDLEANLDKVPEKVQEVIKRLRGETEKYNEDLLKNFATLVGKYGDTEQKIATIRAKAKVETDKVRSALTISINDSTLSSEEKKALKKRAENIIKAIEAEAKLDEFKASDDYIKFFSELNVMTTRQAATTRTELRKAYLKAFHDGAISADELRRNLRAIDTQFKKLTEDTGVLGSYLTGGFDKANQKVQEYADNVAVLAEKMKSGKELSEVEQAFATKMLRQFGWTSEQTENINSYQQLIESFSKNGEGIESAGAAFSQMGEGMSSMAADGPGAIAIIDAIFKGVNGTIVGIQEFIDELNRLRSEENKLGKGFRYASDWNKYITEGWEKVKAGDVIGATMNLASAVTSIFNNIQEGKVEKINDQIDDQSKYIEDLEYQYGRLGVSIAKAFGSDYITNYNKQLETLMAKQEAYLKQAEAERSKGKSADSDKIREYENSARDVADQIADMQSQLSEFFAGTDLTSAAKDFASAWIDAYKEFGSVTDAMKEKFNDMIQEMVENSIAAQIMQELLRPIFDEIDALSREGGELSMEDVARIADMTTEAIPSINQAMTTLMNTLAASGYNVRQNVGQFTGIARNIANASEESINGLAQGVNTQNWYLSYVPGIHANVAAILEILSGGSAVQGTQVSSTVVANNALMMSYLENLGPIKEDIAAIKNALNSVISSKYAETNNNVVGIRM